MASSKGMIAGGLALALGMACGSGDDGSEVGGGDGGTGGLILSSGGTGLGPGAAGALGCQPSPDDTGCVGEQYAGETVPLDIYIMFDQSCSMSCPVSTTGQPGQCCPGEPDPRIDPVRQAMDEFLNAPESAGISVGIGYFGFMDVGSTSCDPADYATPAVAIDRLPSNASSVLRSLSSVTPTGETPTGAAIRGACTVATDWATSHPGHAVVILLVTDGVPETPSSRNCSPPASVADAAAAASECQGGTPHIPTYVLGIGQALSNLNQIADAGGTNQAYLVDGSQGSVLDALNQIRGAATIPCELSIPQPPPGETLETNQVNVGVCDSAGQAITTYYVETPDQCATADGGWYYDDPSHPLRIMLCGPTCDTVSVPGASLYFTIGCQTQIVPPQ